MSEIEDSELKLKAQKMLSNMVEYELPPTQDQKLLLKLLNLIWLVIILKKQFQSWRVFKMKNWNERFKAGDRVFNVHHHKSQEKVFLRPANAPHQFTRMVVLESDGSEQQLLSREMELIK